MVTKNIKTKTKTKNTIIKNQGFLPKRSFSSFPSTPTCHRNRFLIQGLSLREDPVAPRKKMGISGCPIFKQTQVNPIAKLVWNMNVLSSSLE